MKNSTYRSQKQTICTNCGKPNHHFRNCTEPIYSYGIIAFRNKNPSWNQVTRLLQDDTSIHGFDPDDIEILMIQRRDSIGFIELLRGKYKLTDINYIKEQISGTTQKERKELEEKTFEELWIGLWGKETFETNQYKQEYEQAKFKFEQLQTGVVIDDVVVSLRELLKIIPITWSTPEWGFPKGRRNIHEKDVQCAIREFTEESGLHEHQFTIIKNIQPICETFYGNNAIHYCHVYYLAWIHSDVVVKFDSSNQNMIKEIGDIQWFSYQAAQCHIRATNTNKHDILKRAFSIITSMSILMCNSSEKEKEEVQNRSHEYGYFGNKQRGTRKVYSIQQQQQQQQSNSTSEQRRTYKFVEE